MFVKSFGLFWRKDEVDWNPGAGRPFRLLGRRGANRGTIRIADFRQQTGIYILYGNHGAYYVGLTDNLGSRLRDHVHDQHRNKWDRFSWFGFRRVQVAKEANGFRKLGPMATITLAHPTKVIRDVEALIIRATGVHNINQMGFTEGKQWEQIKIDEIEKYLERVW